MSITANERQKMEATFKAQDYNLRGLPARFSSTLQMDAVIVPRWSARELSPGNMLLTREPTDHELIGEARTLLAMRYFARATSNRTRQRAIGLIEGLGIVTCAGHVQDETLFVVRK